MSVEAVNGCIDLLIADDVEGLKARVAAKGINVDEVFEEHDHCIEYEVTLMAHAVQVNAVNCVKWLITQGVDVTRKIFSNPDVFQEYGGKCSKNDIPVDDSEYLLSAEGANSHLLTQNKDAIWQLTFTKWWTFFALHFRDQFVSVV